MTTYRAPGRANLIGEHTDHTGGLVLPAAIDRAVVLDAEPGGERIVLRSRDASGALDVAADGSDAPQAGWGRYVAAVAAELAELGRPAVGLSGELRSDLPQGAGLSSSAALEVVAGLALCDVAGFPLPPLELAALARRAEHRAVGVPSGIMDQAASLLGRAGHAVLLDCTTLEHRHVPLPDDHELVLLDSGVRRELETSDYAARSRELAAALPALGERRPAEVASSELDALLRAARVDAVPARRLRHVVEENERVRRCVEALEVGDLEVVGGLLAASHASLRDRYEVSTPELDALVELALAAGAVGARMTGAGFGGTVLTLVHRDRAAELATEVVAAYQARFEHRTALAHRCRASDGASRL
jgi:galactokinase